MIRLLPLLFVLLLLLHCAPVGAVAAAEPAVHGNDEDEPRLDLPGIRLLDSTHSYFSGNIERLSDRFDSFFGDDRIFEEASGTYVQVRGSSIYSKSGEWSFDTRVRAKISLDNLSDRVQILFSGDDDPADADTITTGGDLDDTLDDLDPAASLQFLVLEQERWDLRLQPGVKIRTPVDPFFKVRLRRQQGFGGRWLWRTTFQPAWYDSRGYELPLAVDFERGIGSGGLFRWRSGLLWREDDNKNVVLRQSLLYAHPLGRRMQLAYEIGAGFEREPNWRDTDYFATVRLRSNIHRGWVFLELKPQIVFTRAGDFDPEPSIALTLEMLFGSAYLK